MLKRILQYCTLLLLISSVTTGTVIYRNNFDDDDVGRYTLDNLIADWGPTFDNGVDIRGGRTSRVSIVDGPDAFGERSLRVTYPANTFGTNDITGGGAQWQLNLDQGYDELHFSYRVKFGKDFNPVQGGKLPGIAGGTAPTGGTIANGTNGFSARMHWRPAPFSFQGDRPALQQYVYSPGNPGLNFPFGEEQFYSTNRRRFVTNAEKLVYEDDVWYQFQSRVVMNTPGVDGGRGQSDGIMQAWVNGVLVLDVQNMYWRDVEELKADQIYFSTFYGGGNSSWAPPTDQEIFFDDFVVSTTFLVPEPTSSTLVILSGLLLLGGRRRRSC